MNRFRYRPDIDGLRAVAVILVILFHANLGFSGGYVGVDVFFVISGYLITGLILKEQQANQFSLSNFWVRRIRRILPAAFVLVAITLAAGCAVLLPEDLTELAESSVAQQLMLSNIYFWKNTGYFGGPAETKPLLHTWSLAVEEQFYLVYPFLLMFCNRITRKFTFIVLLGLAVVSFGISEWGVRNYPSATFFLLPTRMWELLMGAILVLSPQPSQWKIRWLEIGAWVGFVGIFVAGWTYNSNTQFPGSTALLPCFGTALVIYTNTIRLTSLGRILSNKWLVFLGLMSYSLYLWHWPILAFLHYWLGPNLTTLIKVIAIVLSVLCAYASWRFVETPFRRRISPINLQKTVFAAVTAATVLVFMSVWISHSRGLPGRLPGNVQQFLAVNDTRQLSQWNVSQITDGKLPLLGVERVGLEPIDFIVWGDSHAEALGDLLHELSKDNGISATIAARHATAPLLKAGRPPFTKTFEWNDSVLKYIKDNDVSNVVLVAKWASYVEEQANGRTDTRISDMQSTCTDHESAQLAFRRGLVRTLDALERLKVQVWIMKQVPLLAYDPKLKYVQAELFGQNLPTGISIRNHCEKQRNVNSIIDSVAMSRAMVRVLNPGKYCFNEQCNAKVWSKEGVFYTDDNHLSPLGANRLLRPMFALLFHQYLQEP